MARSLNNQHIGGKHLPLFNIARGMQRAAYFFRHLHFFGTRPVLLPISQRAFYFTDTADHFSKWPRFHGEIVVGPPQTPIKREVLLNHACPARHGRH